MKIAVAGGTGVVGTMVVEQLRARGHEPVVLSRSKGVDLLRETDLEDWLDGVEAIVDVTSTATLSADAATRFFTTTTGNLLTAGYAAGVRHYVLLSIVGIDVVPLGYYVGKLAQEELVKDSKIPSTIVRATQFHEFAAQMIDRSSFGPFVFVPPMKSAPIAAAEVAKVIADLAVGVPQGITPEVRGPREESVTEMTRALIRKRGSRQLVLKARIPGKAGKGMRNGSLIPTAPGTIGTLNFDAWLADQ